MIEHQHFADYYKKTRTSVDAATDITEASMATFNTGSTSSSSNNETDTAIYSLNNASANPTTADYIDDSFVVPSTGARLTLYTGLAVLKRYYSFLANSSVLSASLTTPTSAPQSTVTEPHFNFSPAPDEANAWIVQVHLPAGAPFQSLWSGPHRTKPLGKLLLAVKVCKRLYELGALDDNLQPTSVKMDIQTPHKGKDGSGLEHHRDAAKSIIMNNGSEMSEEIEATMRLLAITIDVHGVNAFLLFLQARSFLLLFMDSHSLPPNPFYFKVKESLVRDVPAFTCEMHMRLQTDSVKVVSDIFKEQGLAICHAILLLCMKLDLVRGMSLRQTVVARVSPRARNVCGLSTLRFLLAVEGFVVTPDNKRSLLLKRRENYLRSEALVDRFKDISGLAFLNSGIRVERFFAQTLAEALFVGGLDFALWIAKDLIGDDVFPEIIQWKDLSKAFAKNSMSHFPHSLKLSAPLMTLDDQDIKDIETIIGYTFKNKLILQNVFTPTSISFDRFGYLGNAAMSLFVTLYWMRCMDEEDQGRVSNKINEMITSNIAGRLFYRLELYKFIKDSKRTIVDSEITRINELIGAKGDVYLNSRNMKFPKLFTDTMEALIGAVLVDSDFDVDEPSMVFMKTLVPLMFPPMSEYDF
ncbi:hypothetical protein BX616_001306 [Lobosporangium transversale]|uniref:Uncharacterized protein n=1 Tax=Lobosporangium transversale TaxID=64571 RepID=A0A1Y2GSH6_9FUNG|nr:hypothetical protein BCR41DRAFT_349968 [Lobosporangium transversale]KAF9904438.1 hypothetical protein BX616_001306 [Lobosporangium transversale]ORZ21745.1 hypothetical protein BCR41DRAFT_349968 [Lobosporangium transversale]|eukprot:XP_021882996.1 hypothetical protein BCR41DRAFT_349968 [Lobosporangium transversale]